MKKVNLLPLFLAMCVIASFLAVAVSIGYRNIWATVFFTVLGFVIMSLGIRRKKLKTT